MDEHGATQSSFDEKDRIGVSHFKNIFKAPPRAFIAEVIRVTQFFPMFMEEEDILSFREYKKRKKWSRRTSDNKTL